MKKSSEQHAYGKAARRRQRSRKRYGMYCLLAVLMMLCIGITLSLTVVFNITQIDIEGESRYADDALIAASGVSIGDNLFRLSPRSIENAIVDKFPYIESVGIKRVLPEGLIIKVKEATCAAAVEFEDEYMLISEKGRVLESGLTEISQDEQRVIGFNCERISEGDYLKDEDRERFSILRKIKKSIADNELDKISIIDLRDTTDLRLLYDGRIDVEMGNANDIDYKIRAAKSVIDLSDSGKTVALLDVSSRPAMRLREMNIYDEMNWPFPDEMRDDYKRAIPKRKPAQISEPVEEALPQDNTETEPERQENAQ